MFLQLLCNFKSNNSISWRKSSKTGITHFLSQKYKLFITRFILIYFSWLKEKVKNDLKWLNVEQLKIELELSKLRFSQLMVLFYFLFCYSEHVASQKNMFFPVTITNLEKIDICVLSISTYKLLVPYCEDNKKINLFIIKFVRICSIKHTTKTGAKIYFSRFL